VRGAHSLGGGVIYAPVYSQPAYQTTRIKYPHPTNFKGTWHNMSSAVHQICC